MQHILRVYLDKQRYEIIPIPDMYLNLGGRGLTSRIIKRHPHQQPPKRPDIGLQPHQAFLL